MPSKPVNLLHASRWADSENIGGYSLRDVTVTLATWCRDCTRDAGHVCAMNRYHTVLATE